MEEYEYMETVQATETITYTVTCPECNSILELNEQNYPVGAGCLPIIKDLQHGTIMIDCYECNVTFMVE